MTLFRLLVWRQVLGDLPRTALTIGGVALGVAVYVAVATATVDILRSFEQAVLGVAGRTTLQIATDYQIPGGFDETVIETVSRVGGIIQAAPVLDFTATLIPPAPIVAEGGPAKGAPPAPTITTSSHAVIPVLGVDLLADTSVRDYRIVDESSKEADWERYLEPDTIFLGRKLAARHGLTVGATMDLRVDGLVRRVVVRGILEGSGVARATLDELAVMDIAGAQLLFNRLGRLDRIDLITDPDRPVESVRQAVQAALPPGLTVKRPGQRTIQIERMTHAFRLNVSLLSVMALLVGLFLVYNTVSFAALRRRRDIGILRSLGLSSRGIVGCFLTEVALLGVLGAIAGIGFGLALSNVVLRTLTATVSNLYDAVPSAAQATWVPAVLLQGLAIGVIVAVAGSLGPIREAVSVEPTRALAPGGGETVEPVRIGRRLIGAAVIFIAAALAALPDAVRGLPLFGYLSMFLVLLGFAWISPVVIRLIGPGLRALLPLRAACLARLAADELDRAPVRNAVAVSALIVGLALMIGVSMMIHSFRQTVDLWLEQTVKADLIVAPPGWLRKGPDEALPESVYSRLQNIPGVIAADSYRVVKMEFRELPVEVVARDLLVHARHSRYLFIDGESAAVLSEAVRRDQAVVSETFARQFRLGRGDRLALPGPQGPVELAIAGVFYDYSTDGGKVVLDRTLYRRIWGDSSATVVPLYAAPGADMESVRRAILDRLPNEPVMILTNAELKREVLRIFDQTFAITYALEIIAVTVALLGIVNALLAGILERRRELAVLRAIGGTPAQIGRLIVWEAGWLALTGTVLGAAAGVALSVLLIAVINKQSFGWTILFHPEPWMWLQAAALAVLMTLLAGYLPARRAARLPVAEGLQYE